jgi:hypothetical protein
MFCSIRGQAESVGRKGERDRHTIRHRQQGGHTEATICQQPSPARQERRAESANRHWPCLSIGAPLSPARSCRLDASSCGRGAGRAVSHRLGRPCCRRPALSLAQSTLRTVRQGILRKAQISLTMLTT